MSSSVAPATVPRPGPRPVVSEAVQAASLSFSELVDLIVARNGVPVDSYGVAAALESEGIRDVDARERFGSIDVFDLAEDVYGAALQKIVETPIVRPSELTAWSKLVRFLRFYARGVLFALPIVLQLTTVILVQVRTELTDAQATAVMLGSILSFAATGGFSQAIGRLGSTDKSRTAYHLTRIVVLRIISIGLLSSLALGALVAIVGFTLAPFPHSVVETALAYQLLLSWLWLSLSVLYMLERRTLVVAMVALWLGVFTLLITVAGTGVVVSQLAGYAVAALVATAIARVDLKRFAATTPPAARSETLPRWPILFVGTAPYFVYGILYFGLLFTDRIVGWSAGAPDGFLFYFHRRYELGLDWALVLTVAALESTIHEFGALLEPTQRRFTAARLREHNRAFFRFYLKQVAIFVAIALLSGFATYGIVARAGVLDHIPALHVLVEQRETVRVFQVAVLAYALLAFALMNAVVLFFLSRPKAPLWGLGLGLVATIVVGTVASRTIAPWTSCFGLLAGTGVFALITCFTTVRVVRRMDFFYYAAY